MAEVTKRPTKRVFLALLMIAMLLFTASLTAEEETGGGEDTAGYCQNVATMCNSQCLSSWYACRSLDNDADLCQRQYDWCREDCISGDFWCGYRQV